MSVTFGSVGDIIAICQIVQSVVKALGDSQGSAPEYQKLVLEIDLLAGTSRQIQRLSDSLEAKADVDPLNKELQHCYQTLESIQIKILKYKNSLSEKKGSGNPIRDGYWKLRWQNHKEQVIEYKQQVSRHYTHIQTQMQILGMGAAASDNQKLNVRFDKTDSMLMHIAEAVRQRPKNTQAEKPATKGTRGGVLISGYVRASLEKVQAIAQSVPKGIVKASPIGKGFEEAAMKCKQQCQELAHRCRKENTFFRDADFEMDEDLTEGHRDCLEGLVLDEPDAEESPEAEESPDAEESPILDPRNVQRIRDIFTDPHFSNVTEQDLGVGNQNASNWLQAGIATAYNAPSLLDRLCVFKDQEVGIYGFLFHKDGRWAPTVVDDNLYMRAVDYDLLSDQERFLISDNSEEEYRRYFQTGSRSLYFSASLNENETWLPLFEKAYAKAHGDYSALLLGHPGEAIEDFTGGVSTQTHTRDIIDRDRFWKDQLGNINQKYLFTVRKKPYGDFQGNSVGATPIIRIFEGFGVRLVLLRSFQDDTKWAGPWSNASSEWTPEWMQRLNHTFANPNIFWIEYRELLRKYMYIDRTRIFDEEWAMAQQWTTVEAHQDDDYQDTSFLFILQRNSMVVLSLSQVDSRYFRGLEGLYRFQLHFHVYAEGENELLAASRGSYLGSRSVSTECELPPGRYTVHLRISATKLDTAKSVTEVISQNSRQRRSKLLQAGLQYDIAHAKALNWSPLRTKQVQRERERLRKTKSSKKSEDSAKSASNSEDTSAIDDEDSENEVWDAICAIGLKVFSYDPDLQLEVIQPPDLMETSNENAEKSSVHASK